MSTSSNPCDASFLSQLWSGNAIVCSQSFRNYQVDSAVQQQVDTLQNVQNYYGNDPTTVAVAASSTAAAIAAAPGDVDSIDNSIAATTNCDGLDFSFIGGGCISTTYIWIAVGAIVLIVLLAIFADVRSIL